jgi:amino acid adenylation domain-containing protein
MQEVVDLLSHLRSLDVRISLENGQLKCTAPNGVLTAELKARLRENKFTIVSLLSQAAQVEAPAQISKVSRDGSLSPSLQQERLWFLEQFEGNNAAYNIAGGLRLRGRLNRHAVEASWREMIRRHEVLRSSFVNSDGNPRVVIHDAVDWNMEVRSLRDLPAGEREDALLKLAWSEAMRPFDLAKAPLVRVCLVEMDEQDHALISCVHHIAADGWSLGIIIGEFEKLYPAFCDGLASPLPELPLQYVDYAKWHRDYLESPAAQPHLEHWKQQLRAPLSSTDLPFDRPRPPVMSFRGKRVLVDLPAQVLSAAQKFCAAENVTLFTVLLAAFDVLLFRYTGEPDVIVGTAGAGRTRPELESLIGLFINNLPLRADLSGDPTVRELLQRVRETTLSAFSHQDISFNHLIDAAQGAREVNRPPLFRVMFILQNFAPRDLQLKDLTVELLEFESGTSRFDLTVEVREKGQELRFSWEYNTDLFDDSTMARMQEHYRSLLEGMLNDPEKNISQLSMMTAAEQSELAESANASRAEYPSDLCVHDLFRQQVAPRPDALAVIFGAQRLTYQDLDRSSNRLANRLLAMGVGPGSLVGVCLDRSPHIPIALMAVLKVGGAYVPLDPQYPRERIEFMMEDSRASVLITEEHLLPSLPQRLSSLICMDRDRDLLNSQSDLPPLHRVTATDLAYVIYTSGSTGKPKGVEITHRAVVNFLSSMRIEPGFLQEDRLLAVTTICFDIAGLEFYLPLTCGGTVVIAPRQAVTDGPALAQLLESCKITVMQATPVTWRLLLDSGWQGQPGLKILCGGEGFPRDLADRLLNTGAEVWNVYGPTETTIWSTVQRVHPGPGAVPIGRPIANTQVYVLDRGNHPVPKGVTGELYIGGDGLARGYLNRPELTSERFVPNPFREGERLYRTGDLARFLSDGTLECLGRIDNQVKLRGFRIELGEIEAALEQQPDIRQAVVMVREDVPNDKCLTGYLVATAGSARDLKAIREALSARLPEYMVPSRWVFLDSFPLTPNRKVDRRALPAPEVNVNNSAAYVPPSSDSEIQVAAIWERLLKQSRIGVNDNFFDLGGHSLVVVQLQNLLRKQFHQEISLVQLFQKPTVAAIAALIDAQNGKAESPRTLVPQL